MPQPQPGQFDRGATGARVARLADALLAVDPAAPPRTGRQPEIACDLTPIAEVLVEHLVRQRRCERRAQAFEPAQELAALRHLRRRRCRIRLSRRLCERLQLLAHQHQPRVLALDLRQQPRRHWLALPIPLRRQPAQPVAPARVPDRHPHQPQQRLDPVGVSGLLRDQPVALAARAAGVLLLRAGTRTIRTTRGSPRRYAISVRSRFSPSIRSVFTRRARCPPQCSPDQTQSS